MSTAPADKHALTEPDAEPDAPGPEPALPIRLAALLAAAALGDEHAFTELYDLTSGRIHGVALQVLRSDHHAAEVCQELYLEVWKQAARYAPGRGSVLTWMTTMAHGRAVDRVRSVTSDTARDDRYARESEQPLFDLVWAEVESNLVGQRVRLALESLTVLQREAVTLSYFAGYTGPQLAELLGVPVGTLKTRIRDGLLRLRLALAD